jgi:FdhE protein
MPSTGQKIAALQHAARTSPEYADIIPLFMGIYGYVLGREDQSGISIEEPNFASAEKIEKGVPQIVFGDLKIDREQTVAFLRGISAVLILKGQENADYLRHIDAALHEGTIDPSSLYAAILERRRAPIHELSDMLAVPAPLIEYIFEIPLKTGLENISASFNADSFAGWQEPFCPVCGSRAGMAELSGEEGRRSLSCSACSFSWPFKRLACPYCGCEDPEKRSYFSAGDGATRVDTCTACSRYIKTRDSRKSDGNVPLEIEDLLTIHLDLLAAKEGFERGK